MLSINSRGDRTWPSLVRANRRRAEDIPTKKFHPRKSFSVIYQPIHLSTVAVTKWTTQMRIEQRLLIVFESKTFYGFTEQSLQAHKVSQYAVDMPLTYLQTMTSCDPSKISPSVRGHQSAVECYLNPEQIFTRTDFECSPYIMKLNCRRYMNFFCCV